MDFERFQIASSMERCLAPKLAAPRPGAFEPRRLIAADPRADGRRREVTLGRDRVMIARSVAGVRMKIALASHAYRGVVLRLRGLWDGRFTYEIVLVHRDPDLCVPLFEAQDDNEVQAEWRLWARFLGLPALVEREEGRAEADDATLADLSGTLAAPRRRGAAMSRRRPRFLARRKSGRGAIGVSLGGAREIFPGSKDGR